MGGGVPTVRMRLRVGVSGWSRVVRRSAVELHSPVVGRLLLVSRLLDWLVVRHRVRRPLLVERSQLLPRVLGRW